MSIIERVASRIWYFILGLVFFAVGVVLLIFEFKSSNTVYSSGLQYSIPALLIGICLVLIAFERKKNR
jgi:hypothetical protein